MAFTLAACNDEFLDKSPVTDLSEGTAFGTYDNFKAFTYPLYDMFTNTTIATSVNYCAQSSCFNGDFYAGYITTKSSYNPYAFQTITESSSGNGWDFTYIRRANMMLSHVDECSAMSTAEKNHWKAVGYFFHSFWYMELINHFGDVPWVTTVLDDTSKAAYGPRIDRKVVADSVLTRLQWAAENIGDFTSKDGSNTINQDCVYAALSRFTLREGTWRKYHDLGDYQKYFTECARVSQILMAKYSKLYTGCGTEVTPGSGYGEMWTTDDLSKVPGIILYKQYNALVPNNFCYQERISNSNYGLHQATVDLYLCKDGKSISNSSLYNGDKDPYSTFRNRDPRLYMTVMPPYKVVANGSNKPTGNSNATWGYTTNAADREYIDLIGTNVTCSNPGTGMKRLPAQNWGASLLPYSPNICDKQIKAYICSYSGYFLWKNYDCWETSGTATLNTADKPIFKIEEVLLNYAECKWELGQFTQTVADQTINKLRTRVGVSSMVVSAIDDNFEPNKPTGIDPVLWEIRRERIIELMGEGFGFDDVRRWKLAPYFINKQQKGFWTTTAAASSRGLLNETTHLADASLTQGYAYLFADPVNVEGKGWLDKYYLYEVPTNEIVLNPALTQNPGW
jgi:SusD family.